MSVAEILGVASGALAIYLIARESIWGWPMSIISAGIYVLVFYRARLYADAGLQICYVGLSAYGWLAWWQETTSAVARLRIVRASSTAVAVALIVGGVGAIALYRLLSQTDAALPWLDAPTASFSLVGQWMQARKWIQNWPLWIAVDLVYVGLYYLRSLYLTAGLYAVFAVLAIVGWRAWHRTVTERSPLPLSSS